MTYRIRFASEAKIQIEESDAWWAENRPTSRTRLSDEIEHADASLTAMPNRGRPYKNIRDYMIRRLRLRGTPYFLYYIVHQEQGEIVVVAAWSGEVREGPPLGNLLE